jgi:hypothetical protein
MTLQFKLHEADKYRSRDNRSAHIRSSGTAIFSNPTPIACVTRLEMLHLTLWDTGSYGILDVMGYWVLRDARCYGIKGVTRCWVL